MTDLASLYTDNLLPEPTPLFSEEQLPQIQAFREREDVQNYLKEEHHDEFLARWLIARDWNIDEAAQMFIDSMIWREENRIDEILEWFPETENFEKTMAYWPSSRARGYLTVEGWPVYYERVGMVDAKDLLANVTEEDLTNFHIYEQEAREELRRELYAQHGFSTGTLFIQDLSNLGMKNIYRPGLTLIGKLSDIDKKNYPETVRKMFMINAPTAFPLVWNVAKTFFDPEVIKKFSIHGSNAHDILERILPEGEIPDFAGGTMENPAPGGVGYNWHGTEQITVSSSSSKTIEIQIDEPNTQLSWYFHVDSHDVSFKILQDNETIEDFGRQKKHEDSIQISTPGTITLVFDNSFSWTKSKKVNYKYSLTV